MVMGPRSQPAACMDDGLAPRTVLLVPVGKGGIKADP